MTFFRHTKWLEAEIADLKLRHDKHVAELRELHQKEMERFLAENNRLQAEVDRIRLALGQPGTREPVEEPPRLTSQDPDAMPVFLGTPFERVQQREQWLESPAGRRWMKQNAAPFISSEKKEEEKQHATSG